MIISACTIDFRPTLTYQLVHISWLAAATFDLFLRCVWCIILLEKESTVVSSGVRDVTLVTHLFPLGWVFAIFRNQTWYCGAPPWARMSCEKMGFYLQGQGHSVGFYNQNMTVSTISFISSEPVSFATKLNLSVDHRKQNVQWKCWIAVFKVNVTAKVKSFS